jgi:hypothetical protein
MAAASWVNPGASTSRDGWWHPTKLNLESTTSRPDEESWDFDGNMQDFGEK